VSEWTSHRRWEGTRSRQRGCASRDAPCVFAFMSLSATLASLMVCRGAHPCESTIIASPFACRVSHSQCAHSECVRTESECRRQSGCCVEDKVGIASHHTKCVLRRNTKWVLRRITQSGCCVASRKVGVASHHTKWVLRRITVDMRVYRRRE